MIKRYGNRIVLADVERKILLETHLINKCLWYKEKSKLLVFCLIKNVDIAQKKMIIDKLRIKLLHGLPKEWYPDYVDILKHFPLTDNGKIDKEVLIKAYLTAFSKESKDRSSSEIFYTLILKYFGYSKTETDKLRNYTFLEIGGNSIILLQFFEEIRSYFCSQLPNDFLESLLTSSIGVCEEKLFSLNPQLLLKRKEVNDKSTLENAAKSSLDCSLKFNILWKYDMKACVDCSPTLLNKKSLVAVGSFSHIFALVDVTSGLKHAEVVLPETIEAPCCHTISEDYVFVGCFDSAMYCVKTEDASVVWKFITGDRIKSTPCLCRDEKAIAFGSYDKHVYCLNTEVSFTCWS